MFKPMLSRKFAFKLRQGPSIFHRGWSKPPVEMHLKETCKSARKSTASVGQQIRRRRRSTSKDLWSSEGSARPGHLGSEPKPNIGHAVYAVPRRTAALAALAWPLSPTLLGFRGPDTRPSTTGLYFEPANKPRAGASGLGFSTQQLQHTAQPCTAPGDQSMSKKSTCARAREAQSFPRLSGPGTLGR